MYYFIALIIPVMSLTVGYLYGKDHVDPNTTEGKIYYSKGETK